MGEAMDSAARLPNDVSRCEGAHENGPTCPQRDTCRRYLERKSGAWYVHPQIPGPCAYYKLAEATYFLCAIPPKGERPTWVCDYCNRHRRDHGEDGSCPERGQAAGGER